MFIPKTKQFDVRHFYDDGWDTDSYILTGVPHEMNSFDALRLAIDYDEQKNYYVGYRAIVKDWLGREREQISVTEYPRKQFPEYANKVSCLYNVNEDREECYHA